MKLHILISLLLIFGTVFAQQSTKISFLVEYEDEQEEDYIELGLTVSAEGSSLVNVMSEAKKIAQEIQSIAIEFCQVHAKKKTDCKDIVEIGNYDIKPKYQIVKRQSTFMGFEVTHEVAIKVLAVDHISDLADTILKEPNTKIVYFEWKPLEEVNKEQTAVKQGTQQGEELCDELGMHLGSIENVQEMTEASNQDIAVYQFEIECISGKKIKKSDAKEAKNDKKEEEKGAKKVPKKEEKKEDKKQQKKQEKKDTKKVTEEKKIVKTASGEL